MKKIIVTGSDGLCGRSLQKVARNYKQFFYNFINREVCDLTNEHEVLSYFDFVKPDYVIHTAAMVGGLGGHNRRHADFFHKNMLINMNVISACAKLGVEKLISFSSVCAYPDGLPELVEDKMHDGPVYDANFGYGYAKRMVDVFIRACKEQYGVGNYTTIVPGNIYGPNDMYNLKTGHIIPSLIHKLYLAKKQSAPFVIWGDGESSREFIFVDDLSHIIYQLLSLQQLPNTLIVSGRENTKIRTLVNKLTKVANFSGEVVYDKRKPNGQRNRPSSKKLIDSIFPDMKYTSLDDGLRISWDYFDTNYPNVRM